MEAFGPLVFPHPSKITTAYNFHEYEHVGCIFCSKVFILPSDEECFLDHLLMFHKLLITEHLKIASMKLYCDYWRHRFLTDPPEKICTKIKHDRAGYCYVLASFHPEDKAIRLELKNKRLAWALEQQAREREDKGFKRGCLMCRLEVHGTRADYLTHLQTVHNMHLGQSENLVFIDNFLKVIEDRLNSLRCLFCDKEFKDKSVLKEHMRKKQHKKINPEHNEFDKFYIVNYLEMGKPWKEVKKETDDEFQNQEMAMSDEEWSEWDEMDREHVVCLFCTWGASFEEVLQHMKSDHRFHFKDICTKFCLTFYQRVKLVNYIRHQIFLGKCPACLQHPENLIQHMNMAGHFTIPDQKLWDQPEHYFPTYENDTFLCQLDELEEIDVARLMNSLAV